MVAFSSEGRQELVTAENELVKSFYLPIFNSDEAKRVCFK